MRFIVAIVACFLEIMAWTGICLVLGLRNYGGVIPMVVLAMVLKVTWSSIVKRERLPVDASEEDDQKKRDR